MNNRKTPNPLDRLLCDWAQGQAPSTTDLDLLTSKIVQAADEPLDSSDEPILLESFSVLKLGPAAWVTLGAAAVVLLTLGFVWLAKGTKGDLPSVAGPSDLPPSYAWLQDEQLRNKAILLDEMESVFGRRLNWLAETGDNVQVDVGRQSSTGDGQALAVRVVVQRRRVGRQNWTVAWAIDVVARNEEVVRLQHSATGDPGFEMWAFALPDGMIALDTEVNLSGAVTVRSSASELQADRELREVLTTQSDGFEYRVFQTAAVLNDRLS